MLKAWLLARSVDAREGIALSISDLLETLPSLEDEGEVFALGKVAAVSIEDSVDIDARLVDFSRSVGRIRPQELFADLVTEKFQQIRASVPSDHTVVWGGGMSGVREFAEEFVRLISPPQYTKYQAPLTIKMREKFEAATGIDCAFFYSGGSFNQPLALNALEEFVDRTAVGAFVSGARYFFGHRIPD